MSNAQAMRYVSTGLECESVFEDPYNRLRVSAVSSKDLRREKICNTVNEAKEDIHRTKRLIIALSEVLVSIAVPVMMGIKMNREIYEWRGREAFGSEYAFYALIGFMLLAFFIYLNDKVIRRCI